MPLANPPAMQPIETEHHEQKWWACGLANPPAMQPIETCDNNSVIHAVLLANPPAMQPIETHFHCRIDSGLG